MRLPVFSALLFTCCLTTSLRGAELSVEPGTDSEDMLLLYSHPSLVNPWMSALNPAGHLFFEAHERISRVTLQGGLSEEPMRRAMDPGLTRQAEARTETFQSIGKARVRGLFEYQNQHYRDMMYNGNMDFRYTNLYMLGDTLGGRQRQEGYRFEAEGAYPVFGEQLYLGMRMDYETAVGAKMQDLRNRSTISRMRLTPGLIYNSGSWSAGLSGGFISEINYVHVRAILDERHTLFYHMGMGHYSASGNFSGSESVRYETSGFHGGFQFSYRGKHWQSLHTLHYKSQQTNALVGSSFRLNNGISDFSQLTYQGDFQLDQGNRTHWLQARFNTHTLYATEVRQQRVSINRDGVWYEEITDLRRIPGKHIVNDLSAALDYHFLGKGEVRPYRYQLTASAGINTYSATHFPRELYGFFDTFAVSGNLGYRHFFRWGELNVDPGIRLGAHLVMDSEAEFRPFPNYLEQIPELDYHYFSQSAYLAELSLSLSTQRTPLSGFTHLFMDIRAGLAFFPDANDGQQRNQQLSLSLGFMF